MKENNMTTEAIQYIDDLPIETEGPSEFAQFETPEEIVNYIADKALEQLMEDEEFMKEHPSMVYAQMRADYLAEHENPAVRDKLYLMYDSNQLVDHLKEVQQRGAQMYQMELPSRMEAWNVQDKKDPMYRTMTSALFEVIVKEVVELEG